MLYSVVVDWRDRGQEYERIKDWRPSPISGEPMMMLVDDEDTVIYLRGWESIMITKEVKDHD